MTQDQQDQNLYLHLQEELAKEFSGMIDRAAMDQIRPQIAFIPIDWDGEAIPATVTWHAKRSRCVNGNMYCSGCHKNNDCVEYRQIGFRAIQYGMPILYRELLRYNGPASCVGYIIEEA